MAFVKLSNGVAEIAVEDALRGYWLERGFSLVEEAQPVKVRSARKRSTRKGGSADESSDS